MKPEELQLGDIVTTTPSGMPIRVVAIHRKKVAYHACTDRFSWVRIGLLQPIPLTPEILKKNGWFPLDEYRYEGDIALAKGRDYFRLKNTTICINSVHELQHTLRLCGIDKEIII